MGNIGSHVNITSGRERHQAKNAAPVNIQAIFSESKAGPVMAPGRLPANGEVSVDSRCF
jgi:hypothetical protein